MRAARRPSGIGPGRPVRAVRQRRSLESHVLDRAGGLARRRSDPRSARTRGHRRDALPHPHRRLPVADRCGEGRQSAAGGLALHHRLPARRCSDAALLPDRGREDRRGGRCSDRSVESLPSKSTFRELRCGALRQCPRPDRQHADGRHQPTQPESHASGCWPSSKGRTPAARSRTGRPST